MTAVSLRFRTEFRRRWVSWLGLALIIGLVGGLVLALAAGARRTDTAYTRFLGAQHAYDVLVTKDGASFGTELPPGPPLDGAAINALPGVEEVAVARRFFTAVASSVGVLVSPEGGLGDGINRYEVLEGRRLDPHDATEIVVGFAFAEQYGVQVGDAVNLFDPSTIDHAPPGIPPDVLAQARLASDRILKVLPGGDGHVVGIEASPGEFPPQIEGTGRYLIHASPALTGEVGDLVGFESGGDAVAVRLDQGAAGVDAFLSTLARSNQDVSSGGGLVVQRDLTTNVVRSLHTQANALRLLALLAAAAGVLVCSQLIARLTFLESEDQPVLGVLGLVRRERFVIGVARAATIGAAAAAIAALVAVAASPLFPTGLADKAEPSPGFRIDGAVVGFGGLTLGVVVVVLSLLPSWLAAGRSLVTGPADAGPPRPSLIGRVLGSLPTPPPVEIGVRMALEPGRGRAAVPVRSTLTAVTLGIAALGASLVFAASLGHLLATPRLYGQTWDAELTTYDEVIVTKGLPALLADARVEGVAVGRTRNGFTISGHRVDGLAIDSAKGGLTPSILDGRPPEGVNEVVVGTNTMRDLSLRIGSTVDVGAFGGDGSTASMRVVGRAVFPVFGEAGQLGDGIYMTRDGGLRVDPSSKDLSQSVLVRLRQGVDRDDVVADLQEQTDGAVAVFLQGKPTDIVNFGRVKQTPALVGALLCLVSGATLLQVLVTAARRRRGDLKVLRALGFVRWQIRATVTWQAVTIVGIALVIGIPLGIAAGLTLWDRFAGGLGVIDEPRVHPWAFVVVVVGGLLTTLVIAVAPAHSAARTRPTVGMRFE